MDLGSVLGVFHVAPSSVKVLPVVLPPLAAGTVTIQTAYSAISAGTERLLYSGEFPDSLELDAVIPELQRSVSYPFLYGYSLVGECVEVGEDVPASLKGARVFAFHPHQSHCRLPWERVMVVPAEIPLKRALFFPFLETAVTLVLDAAPLWGERVALLGLGTIGLLVARLLATFPLERVVGFEPQAHRQQRGLSAGLQACYGTLEEGLAEPPFDVVIELSGTAGGLSDAFQLVAFSGRIVCGSWQGASPQGARGRTAFHRKRVTLLSSQVSTFAPELSARWSPRRRSQRVWDLLARWNLEDDIAEEVPFQEASLAFERLSAGKARGQVVLTYPQHR